MSEKNYFPSGLYVLNETEFRKAVTKIVSVANKRIKRLEKSNLKDSPAYQKWLSEGGVKFSVKGKDYNQLQAEFWRLKNFMDNKTSLVRQANGYLRDMAKVTGIKYGNLSELKAKSKQFFELAKKIKEYYNVSEQSAMALDYQKIWEQINTQIKQGAIQIGQEQSTDEVLQNFLDAMDKVSEIETGLEGYKDVGEWDFIKL